MELPKYQHALVGGRLCLDLLNTVGGLRGHHTSEHLATYADLVAWAVEAGAVEPERGSALLQEAARRPADAARVLEEARALREAIHDAVVARLAGREPASAALATLNGALARALPHRRIACCTEGFDLGWDSDSAALDAPLWPAAQSAADLLTSREDLARVRMCDAAEDSRCGWLFLDETRNRSRRWCSMGDCGNRAKAKRHYERSRRGAR